MNKFGNSGNKTDVVNDFTAPEPAQRDPTVRAVPDKKEQSGVGRFASKGKQLYRTSSRTFQAVAFKQSNKS